MSNSCIDLSSIYYD